MEELKKHLGKLNVYLEKAQPYLKQAGELLDKASPYVPIVKQYAETAFEKATQFQAELGIVFGLFLMFYGESLLFTLIAFEAFKIIGFEKTKQSLLSLFESLKTAQEVLSKDDDSSEVSAVAPESVKAVLGPDADKLTAKAFKLAKTLDPVKVTEGLQGLSVGAIAVIATLQSTLSRCITLGATISNQILEKYHEPIAAFANSMVPAELAKWVEPTIANGSKVIGFFIAYMIQKWLMIFTVCLRGVQLVIFGLEKRSLITKEQVDLASKMATPLAVFGLAKQIWYGGQIYMFLKVLFFPVFLVEWVLSFVAMM